MFKGNLLNYRLLSFRELLLVKSQLIYLTETYDDTKVNYLNSKKVELPPHSAYPADCHTIIIKMYIMLTWLNSVLGLIEYACNVEIDETTHFRALMLLRLLNG